MPSLAFPMRLEENGLLRREESATAIIALLQVMARTPQGTWAACPSFGLRDLFENSRLRADAGNVAMERINEAFSELGITGYTAVEVIREVSAAREIDTYLLTLQGPSQAENFSTTLAFRA